jgi:hypothetical protein
LQKQIPEHATGNDQHSEAQQENQNVLAALPGLLKRGRIRKHAINSHRIRDVFDSAVSERLITANQFVLYLFVDAARNENLARVGDTLKARSDVDAIAVNVVCFDDNVAKIDANPILDPMMLG